MNMQAGEGGKAKPYQVRQVVQAVERLLNGEAEQSYGEEKPAKPKGRR